MPKIPKLGKLTSPNSLLGDVINNKIQKVIDKTNSIKKLGTNTQFDAIMNAIDDEKYQLFLDIKDGIDLDYQYKYGTDVSVPQADGFTKVGSILKGIGKPLKNDLKGFKEELSTSLKNIKKGSISSLRAMVTKQSNNQYDTLRKDPTYSYREENLANRHRDAISGILDNVLDGNLLDAGLNAVKLYNRGTKFFFARAQDVDKDMFHFKYWYYGMGNETSKDSTEDIGIAGKRLLVLDSIEDPTYLGYTLRLDTETSPLLADKGMLSEFITKYSISYPELRYASAYLKEFKEDIVKIFTAPSTKGNDVTYASSVGKPHYILSIAGLDLLDRPFVDMKNNDGDHQSLKIVLHEDVRMFTNRLMYLYRNLSYSYSMGKSLIPENLLRFNLFIKVSDIRSLTGNDDNFGNKIANDYSRIIYELKDCEFLFDGSTLKDNVILGGTDQSRVSDANVTIRIKYRKVNRLFYSSMYSAGYEPFLISDHFYKPDIRKSKEKLSSSKLHNSDEKRKTTSNNIIVETSLKERYDNLKNNGILQENDSDTTVGRFLKVATNNATKTIMQPIDEGVKKIKDRLNTTNVMGQNSFIRKALNVAIDGKIALKGGLRAPKGDKDDKLGGLGRLDNFPNLEIDDPKTMVSRPIGSNITISTSDLHDTLESTIDNPRDILHSPVDVKATTDLGDLHPEGEDFKNTDLGDLHPEGEDFKNTDLGDLHPEGEDFKNANLGDLHPEGEDFKNANLGDLHPEEEYNQNNQLDTVYEIVETQEEIQLGSLYEEVADDKVSYMGDLHNEVIKQEEVSLGDLHEAVDINTNLDKIILNGKVDSQIEMVDADLHEVSNNTITEPISKPIETSTTTVVIKEENVNGVSESVVISPKNDIYNTVESTMIEPNGNVYSDIDSNIEAPNDDLHPTVNHKIEQSDKYSNLKSYLKKRK
jgi:hypothetical protein